jgi:thiol-disulfide isomerase/thioredoxin
MDKWKILVIALLLGLLPGYNAYQRYAASQQTQQAQSNPTPASKSPSKPASKSDLIGKPAPDWSIPAEYWVNTPKPLTLADVKGHVTILEFWRADCSHCQESAPLMEGLYKQYQPRGLRLIAFHAPGRPEDAESRENNWATVQKVIKEWGMTYPVAFDKGRALFTNSYGGNLWPTVVVLDRDGIVRFYQTGMDAAKETALRQFLASAMSDTGASPNAK